MLKKRTLAFFVFLLSILAVFPADAYFLAQEEELDVTTAATDELKTLYAQSAVLMDADSGRILFEKKGYDIMPMASTTKIMTCIIALEHGNPEDIVTVSKNAAKQPKVHLGMREGQQFKLGDLLYSLMLESHNDSAVAIAEHVGGSVEGFALLMNQKARELGAPNTNFVTPNGLDANGHQTTAAELALIARYALTNEQFMKITNTSSYNFSDVTGKSNYAVQNLNAFLGQMEGAVGMKTGFTGKAGYCFVGALKRDGKTFISVVLACGWPPNKTYKWHDTKALMSYGIQNYDYRQVFSSVPLYQTLEVKDGQVPCVDAYIEGELSLLLHKNDTVQVDYECPEQLEAPVEKGQVIGKAKILINGEEYCSYEIKASDDILKIDYKYCFKKILDIAFP